MCCLNLTTLSLGSATTTTIRLSTCCCCPSPPTLPPPHPPCSTLPRHNCVSPCSHHAPPTLSPYYSYVTTTVPPPPSPSLCACLLSSHKLSEKCPVVTSSKCTAAFEHAVAPTWPLYREDEGHFFSFLPPPLHSLSPYLICFFPLSLFFFSLVFPLSQSPYFYFWFISSLSSLFSHSLYFLLMSFFSLSLLSPCLLSFPSSPFILPFSPSHSPLSFFSPLPSSFPLTLFSLHAFFSHYLSFPSSSSILFSLLSPPHSPLFFFTSPFFLSSQSLVFLPSCRPSLPARLSTSINTGVREKGVIPFASYVLC